MATATTTETRMLVEAAQAGDRAAFGRLYQHYREPVFRFIQFRVGNRHVAEDLTGDTFVRALRHLGQYTWQGKDVGAWLFTIARNLIADYYKTSRYRLDVSVDDFGPGRADTDRRGNPAAVAEANAMTAILDAALVELTHGERQVLALRFGADLTVTESARFLDMNEGAVKAAQHRAVRKLRRLLQAVPR